ncbi:receptor-type adenylate cyclase a-like protein [Leptomonas seymouri]|uniref:adenylate cyclase n=1 Tax=Leptomonas seymouri TaxID=5684 RepID=A0A0N0P457_LEPSE|nr:receptor-type adenylate cyclase a-like protein [Leptomonas seymouri]|eukprot:KPI84909.1 receptor-type adenylate cyclase a-like protein [Leptomonas seymouri]
MLASSDDEEISNYVSKIEALSSNITVIIPYTSGTLAFSSESTSTYFLSTDPATEMLALLMYALRIINPIKIGFVCTDLESSPLSMNIYTEFMRRMKALSRANDVVTYKAVSPELNDSAYSTFSKPLREVSKSCVFLFGPKSNSTLVVFEALMTDKSIDTRILVPWWLMEMVMKSYSKMESNNLPNLKPLYYIAVSTNYPHMEDTRWPLVKTITRIIGDGPFAHYLDSSADAVKLVAGWVSGQVVVNSLFMSNEDDKKSQADFQASMFDNREIIVGSNTFLGTFTPQCNIGGRMVLVHTLGKTSSKRTGLVYLSLETIPEADMILDSSQCNATDVELSISRLVQVGLLKYTSSSNRVASYLYDQAMNGGQTKISYNFHWRTLKVDGNLGHEGIEKAVAADPVAALTGPIPIPLGNTAVSSLLVMEPVYLTATLYQKDSNVIYLTPTNEQQWGVAAKMLVEKFSLGTVHCLARRTPTASSDQLNKAAKAVMESAGLTDIVTFGTNTKEFPFPTDGVMLLSGLRESDVPLLAAHMWTYPKVYAVILFDEFTALYTAVQAHFPALNTSTASRLLFVTNLPRWTAGGSDQPTNATGLTASFLAAITDPTYQTPAAMRAYLASRVLRLLSSSASLPSSSALKDALYHTQVLNVDDLKLGPFQMSNCSYSLSQSSFVCNNFTNGGATLLYVWSYERVLDSAVDTMAGPYTVSFDGGNANGPSTGSSSNSDAITGDTGSEWSRSKIMIIAVVASCTCFLVTVISVLLCLCCRGDSRDNRNAPKNPMHPVTLLFTDIESSTALWAMVPQAMAAAMKIHHSIVRELIVHYKCYEVKTIGDSFMIACADPFMAVQLARDTQLRLLKTNWGTTTIDDTYALLGKNGVRAARGGTAAPSAWNGLRVRIGVHCGMAEVQLDKVTKGYDYYGNTVNTAARTEALGIGGQVLCTESVVNALTAEQRSGVDLVSLGPQRLRGVAELVEMYELRVVEGRVFPSAAVNTNPLATVVSVESAGGAVRADNPMMEDSDDEKSSTPSSSEHVAEVLDVYFSAYSNRQKIKQLQRTCQCFSLPKLQRKMYPSDAAYLSALIQSVSSRTSAVIDFRRQFQETYAVKPLLNVESINSEGEFESTIHSPTDAKRKSRIFLNASSSSPNGASSTSHGLLILNSRRQSNGDTVLLLLDNDNMMLSEDETEKGKDRAVGASCTNLESCSSHSIPLEAPQFLNGEPSVSGDKISACFKEGNGKLFRVVDTALKRWAFYNDTKDLLMHVHFSLDQTSMVQWGPNVAGKVRYVATTGCYEGDLLVAPLETEVLLSGKVSTYSMRCHATSAESVGERQKK